VGPARFSYVCHKAAPSSKPAQALQLSLDSTFRAGNSVVITPTKTSPQACKGYTRCGITATGTLWRYNERGGASLKVRRGPAFFNPLYPTAMPAWKTGRGVFGYEGYHYEGLSRRSFPRRGQRELP